MNKKVLVYLIGSTLIFLMGLALFWLGKHPERTKPVDLVKISLKDSFPLDSQSNVYLSKAIETTVSLLQNAPFDSVEVLGKTVTPKTLLSAFLKLDRRLKQGDDLNEAISEIFDVYEVLRQGEKGQLLVTGYYQPEFVASSSKTDEFNVPVLSPPPDLIGVRLRDFDPSLPAMTLWGRIDGQRLLPYFKRYEIEQRFKDVPSLFNPLCWLSSPVDLLELQIQGSAIIKINGKRRFIHYAASNGRPYKSVGKILLKRGFLDKQSLTWPKIRKWANEHPKVFNKILSQNGRYIFFKWEENGPLGCYGKVLVPGVSVALDKRLFPPGLPLIVKLPLPPLHLDGLGWLRARSRQPVSLFVINHDTGSAIKGPFRMDLYTGTGQYAGILAGHLKQCARMFILVPKSKGKNGNDSY